MLGFEHDSIYCFSHINIMVKTYCTDYSFNLINVSSAEHHILYLHMTSFLLRRKKPEKQRDFYQVKHTSDERKLCKA